MALQLVDKAGAGEVTVVSMGSAATSRDCVTPSQWARQGRHRERRRASRHRRLGTAKVLAAVIERERPDLVLAATESSDGYTGTTPVQIAELLGLPPSRSPSPSRSRHDAQSRATDGVRV